MATDSATSEDSIIDYDTDPEELSDDDLADEYLELNELRFSRMKSLDEKEASRRTAVWQELRSRSDVEQPECPECGESKWTFTDHTECASCGHGPTDHELVDEVHRGWEQIVHGE